ncbi:divalent-cation tolerance protein CutA [Pararhodospirillum oryzae]|uniref:Divalent-cation tolerance protein CutA n=1 Tax=Pararhodospirillum oryzae TaxID=478448 RepID=A0A512H5D8_9PROT|nr:divalent-cation tolerance protein CutA [Pararhodospirillum oryzae]GEO80634.1 divalent-cation tolerance protein CutA [Pararhodospirillum oryzae]
MTQCLVYMTAASEDEALRLGRTLVEERLAACVNILGPIRSIFRWEGTLQEETEIAFLAKTDEARVDALTERVTALHSYECPCVVALPIQAGAPDFLAWISCQTALS